MDRPGMLIWLVLGISLLFQYPIAGQPGAGFGVALNSTLGYVNTVNQSAYLIFYPNLTASYSYISNAANASKTDPAQAYSLLTLARSSAQQQLAKIEQYRTDSLYALVAVSIALAALLYALMRPKAQNYRGKNRNAI